MNGNVAEVIELLKTLNDDELKWYGDLLEYVMKLSPDERKEFYDKVDDRLAKLEAQEE